MTWTIYPLKIEIQGQKKEAKAPKPEKRTDKNGKTVKYRAQPSQQIAERIQRALPGSGHRLFLIQRGGVKYDVDNCPGEEFTILGATGNVYTVTIDRNPRCTCPDHEKGNICKHILFVLMRVMKMNKDNSIVWQKSYLTDEIFEIFSKGGNLDSTVASDVQAPQSVVNAFAATVRGEQPEEQSDEKKGRRAVEGDCPICFDELVEGAEELVWCKTCGNNIHQGCFERWRQQKMGAATCVFCRAVWQDDKKDSNKDTGDYVNLANYSQAHKNTDTSLQALYGERAVWINRAQGYMSRGAAANIYRAMQHR
eukprot:TRINITY_DN7484_c1_g1_i5.p1 TRINITY_DN7484_c1_g1~~TRINITY_DN7484_c1_g1_i5.p1  ORF type:complete len:309 (+),score=31.97 TRINITY_DN7484_c1_g1_i5:177-1103(+)